MPRIPHHLFVDEGPLAYSLQFRDEIIGHHYTVQRGMNAAGLLELEFFLEVDPRAFGGGPVVRTRSLLHASSTLRPVQYATQASGRRLELRFDARGVLARLPSGEDVRVGPEDKALGAAFVLENNAIGHIALLAAELSDSVDAGFSEDVVFVNQLLVAPYALRRAAELDRAGARGFRSSLDEELWLDAQGGLVALKQPAHAVSVELVRRGLPSWCTEAPSAIASTAASYSPPEGARFDLHEITIEAAATPIGAAVTVPHGAGPFPAALFVGGSGRHDRHGFAGEIDIGTHELMDQLAERGVCGLRYDSRGAGSTKYGPDVLDEGLEVLIDDAAACLTYLRARPEVDPRRVSIIGHSQGGSVALALAGAHPGTSSVVLMAAPGRRIDEVMADQIRGEGARRGLEAQLVERQLAELEEVVFFAQTEADWTSERVPPRLRSLARSRRWFADHLRLSIDALLRAAAVPILICQGEKDLQISVERDAQRLHALARSAGLEAILAVYPELDHLFKPVTGEPSLNQYFDRSRHVDPGFIADVAAWLSRH